MSAVDKRQWILPPATGSWMHTCLTILLFSLLIDQLTCSTVNGHMLVGYIKGDGAASFVSPPSAVSPSISPKASNTAIKTRDQAIAAGASVAEPGQTCGPKADSVCPPGQCCSYSNYCGITAQHCMANACNAAWGFCGPGESIMSQGVSTSVMPYGGEWFAHTLLRSSVSYG